MGARHLRAAFVETLVAHKQEQAKQGDEPVVHDAKVRVRAIRTRLAEIVERLDASHEKSY